MAKILALSSDLLLGSKVEAILKAAGHDTTLAPSLQEASMDDVELIVADLEAINPEALVGLGVPILGYYSHLNAEAKEASEAAGIDLAVPRSRMSRELPTLVSKLLGG
ncbi:MAG TPA: hypothetical protein VGC63_13605 [Solirubrobacterales bacterium]|jgi:hypothetical protein